MEQPSLPQNFSNYSTFKKVQSLEQEQIENDKINLDINEIFLQDTNLFIGEFKSINYEYHIQKGYIDGKGEQIRLYYTKFQPKEEATCSVCLIHSFGEYSGRYMHVAESLVKEGFEVNMIDLRGFGFSGGPRASSTIHELHMDIETLIQQSSRNIPLFMIGFSMGAMLTTSFLMNNPQLNCSGAVLVNPLINVPENSQLSGHKGFVVKLVGIEFKDIVINSMINLSALTKDSYETMKVFKDRLMIPFMSFSFIKYLLECTEFIQNQSNLFNFPLLMPLGQKDGVLDVQHAKTFFNGLKQVKDKQMVVFPEGYHEMHNDIEFKPLMNCIKDFISKRQKEGKILGNQLGKIKYGYTENTWISKGRILFLIILIFLFIQYKQTLLNNIYNRRNKQSVFVNICLKYTKQKLRSLFKMQNK